MLKNILVKIGSLFVLICGLILAGRKSQSEKMLNKASDSFNALNNIDKARILRNLSKYN